MRHSPVRAMMQSLTILIAAVAVPAKAEKQGSAFFPPELMERARRNIERDEWSADVRDQIVELARPFLEMTDEELWTLPFGNTISRSWMVWSDGHCPSCKTGVPMYNWEIDALNHPWKVRCPHCSELFPKNDFLVYYRSGLDEHQVFDPTRADRSLLFNVGHPGEGDPLRGFGVDDGEGFVADGKRWRFIGTYLIYGHWKQLIVGGAKKLADAYIVTGDRRYARKALILLDRVADLYPTHDFGKQGILYERKGDRGYVSTWHDACGEVRQLAMAYDEAFVALEGDDGLIEFLSAKARKCQLENPKTTWQDVQRNIEQRILVDTLNNRPKIESNYPQTDMAICMIRTILAWPENREEIMGLIDAMMKEATAVDGQSGEKGMAGYTTIAPRTMAEILGLYARMDPQFLSEVYRRHPRLRDMYRFHIDTWCLGQYYPQSGDTGAFARKVTSYVGASFTASPGLSPSNYTLFWKLYELTGDTDFVRVIHQASRDGPPGLPCDLFAENPDAFAKGVRKVLEDAPGGADLAQSSVNKQEWCLAILRGGAGAHQRALWLDYDAGGRHSHADGMNLGLFAFGLDLMPDFGYPPVQFGGWVSPRARWYTMTAAHNTVVVDGKNHNGAQGKTTLWADGSSFQAIRASCPELIAGRQYDRTVGMVGIDPDIDPTHGDRAGGPVDGAFYVFDIFRVIGGTDHAKFFSSHFGTVKTRGLSLKAADDYGHNTQMREFRTDTSPDPGWYVEWAIDDRYDYLPEDTNLHLRYTDLTTDASATLCEAWVVQGSFNTSVEAWIPRVMTRRRVKEGDAEPLASTFVSIIEPYQDTSRIAAIRRVPLQSSEGRLLDENDVAIEIELADGLRDLVIALDVENPLHSSPSLPGGVKLPEQDLTFDGELCMVRRDKAGKPAHIALARARSLDVADISVTLQDCPEYLELWLADRVYVLAGDVNGIDRVMRGDDRLQIHSAPEGR